MQLVQCSMCTRICLPCLGSPVTVFSAIESVQKRDLRIVLPNYHCDGALNCPFPQKGGSLHKFYQAWLPVVSCTQAINSLSVNWQTILPPFRRTCPAVRFVSKTKWFADFCTIKYHDQLWTFFSAIFSLLFSALNHIYIIIYIGRFTRYDFVAYDKLTTSLRRELFLLNQTYNSLTMVALLLSHVVGLS